MENKEIEFKPHWGVLVSYTNGKCYGMLTVDDWKNNDKTLQPILTNEDVKEIIKYGKEEFKDQYFVILNMIPIWMVS